MTRRVHFAFPLLALGPLMLSQACGALGEETPYPAQITNGGAGPYRLATEVETGVTGGVDGQMLIEGMTTGRAALTANAVFYEAAPISAVPPTRDPTLASWQIDWAQHDARRIYRSTTRVVDADGLTRAGFAAGAEVLGPVEAFEAGGVSEPAILELPDGRVRLYYATAQGIGVAEAPSVDGGFARMTTTALLGDVAGHGPASHPAPLFFAGETHLYVEAGGEIFHARAADGVTFTVVDADPSSAAVDPLPLRLPPPVPEDAGMDDAGVLVTEVALGGPAVATGVSLIGRTTIRLAFESHRSDRTVVLAIAGSFDADTFLRSEVTPYSRLNPTSPYLFVRPDGISLLTFQQTRVGVGVQRSVTMLAMTPSRFVLPTF